MAGEIARAFVRIVPNSTGFQSTLMRDTAGVGRSVGSAIGKGLALGIGATVAAAGVGLAVATKLAIGFDRSMRNVNSIAQLSENSFQKLNKQVLDLAAASGTGPTDIANGLYDVVSSGFKASDALKILKASTKGARAGLTDVATSTKVVTAVLNAYHLKATDAAKVTDQLFQTVNVGVLTFEQLSQQIGDVLPFASSLGVGLDQVGASIATMTKEGINAAESTTRLKAVLTQMLSPSKDLSARFKDLGFDSGEAMIRSKGLQGALDILAASTHGSKAEMAKLFPDVRSLGGALALTGANSKTAAQDLKALRDSSGATDRAFKEQSKSISQQWQTMVAKLQVIGIRIGVHVFPLLKIGIDELGKFVGFVDKEIQKISGPTLTGKPLSLKVQAAIVWQDVQPALATAAAGLWALVKAGMDAAFQAAAGSEPLDVHVTPNIKATPGGQTVIPFDSVFTVSDPQGPLSAWWAANVTPLIIDLSKQSGDQGGQSFMQSLVGMFKSGGSTIAAGVGEIWTGLLEQWDGAMRQNGTRMKQGLADFFKGLFHASGLSAGSGVSASIRQMLSGIPGAVLSALKGLSNAVSSAQAAGSRIGLGIISGALSGLRGLAARVGSFALSQVKAASGFNAASHFVKVGASIIRGIISGLATLANRALSAISRALSSAASFDAASLFTGMGADIISGIASGIAGAVGGLISAAVNAVVAAKKAAVHAIKSGSPSKVWADEVGKPMGDGIAVGLESTQPRIKKALHATLNGATKQALVDAKSNLNSLAGGVADAVGSIIDAQVAKAVAPLQAKLDAATKGQQQAASAAQAADLRSQIANATRGNDETDAQFVARMKELQNQLGDLAAQAEQQQIQDQIDGIGKTADAKKAALSRSVADLAAEFNAGKITGKQFTTALTEILKANKADVASAGDLLGFAFAQSFSAQLTGVTKQVAAIAAVAGASGGGAGGAGFGVDVTNPLDVVRGQLKDAKATLKQDQKDARDAKKTKDKKDDAREARAIAHDRAMIRALTAILKFAAGQPGTGNINVNMTAGVPSVEALLAEIFGGAAR